MTSYLVLSGGLSPERDVSLRSGRRVAEALRTSSDAEVIEADVDSSLIDVLRRHRPDCVVPLLHGAAGEDGALRDVLTSLGLPFVGATGAAARLAFDKPVAKTLLATAGVSTPAVLAIPHAMFRELGAAGVLTGIREFLGLPIMVKPTSGGSALGASIVRSAEDFPSAMVGAFAYSDVAMMEQYIDGTEVAVSVLETAEGTVALPAVEIVPESGIYDYKSRYTAGTTEFFVPARLSDELAAECARIAVLAHEVLGLRDWSRTDLIIDAAGTPWFLETNAAPGMTETSLFPQALQAAGLGLGEIANALVRRAAARG
ncbi:MAG: D-alanine--D-alanine ligase [Candidatus Nanopelagicales bacterium]|nr:D-alanine--D-alanine ligase [Candidatus Nanopelagicales bacterium]